VHADTCDGGASLFDGCPNYAQYLPRLQALLADAGLDVEIALWRIESEEAAVEERFLGSPTVRIDGQDVEPNASLRTQYGLQCRLYHTASGWAPARRLDTGPAVPPGRTGRVMPINRASHL
jgi:hypothetical protein